MRWSQIAPGVLLLSGLAAPGSATLLDEGYRSMYNLAFDEAQRNFHQWEQERPADPMGPVSTAAAYLFAEFDRMRILQSEFFSSNRAFFDRQTPPADSGVKRKFEAALDRARSLAGAALSRNPDDTNAMLAEILRQGLHADYMALIEKRYMASLNEIKNSRALAEKLVAGHPDLCDAYLAIGVENYLLSVKPAPIRWLLRLGGAKTDKAEGIAKLQLTAKNGRYLRPYAQLLLAVAAIRDNDHTHARQLLAGLAAEFPRNHLYLQELARLQ